MTKSELFSLACTKPSIKLHTPFKSNSEMVEAHAIFCWIRKKKGIEMQILMVQFQFYLV